jgi:transposase
MGGDRRSGGNGPDAGLTLRPAERAALEAAAAAEPRARALRRYRAVLLLAEGRPPPAVAGALGCSPSSVYNWAAAWQAAGLEGLRGQPHAGGRRRALGGEGEALLADLLAVDPRSRGHEEVGWTVPLLRAELAAAGYELSERTVRRAVRRLGWRWERPRADRDRPGPTPGRRRQRWSNGGT